MPPQEDTMMTASDDPSNVPVTKLSQLSQLSLAPEPSTSTSTSRTSNAIANASAATSTATSTATTTATAGTASTGSNVTAKANVSGTTRDAASTNSAALERRGGQGGQLRRLGSNLAARRQQAAADRLAHQQSLHSRNEIPPPRAARKAEAEAAAALAPPEAAEGGGKEREGRSCLASCPKPLSANLWSSMPGSSFPVRSGTYLDDKVKCGSEGSLFRLVAVDLILAKKKKGNSENGKAENGENGEGSNGDEGREEGLPQSSVCLCPGERVQRALARERAEKENGVDDSKNDEKDDDEEKMPPFIFCVNIIMGQSGSTSDMDGSAHGGANGDASATSVANSSNGATNKTKTAASRGLRRLGSALSSRASSSFGAESLSLSAAPSEESDSGNNNNLPTSPSSSALPTEGKAHMAFYYAIDDLSLIDGTNANTNTNTNPNSNSTSTPESTLLNQFFFGTDDTYRSSRFKLLPRIAQGNVLVKKAVGSKPAIMGRKLRQTYVRSDRFLEVIIDVGSSSVATKIVKLTLSYAKTLVVDLAFLLEGTEREELPERVMGSVRLKNVDFRNCLRVREC